MSSIDTQTRLSDPPRMRRINAILVARFALPALLVIVLIAASLTTPGFMSFANIRAILINSSIVGIAAVGMTAITLSGNFFSLGAASSTVLSGILFLGVTGTTGSILLGICSAFAAMLVLGILQGAIVAAGLNPIITTLAAGAIIYGAVAFATGGVVVTASPVSVGWIALTQLGGIPLPVMVFVLYTAVMWWVTERTVIGRQTVLLGSNQQTAVLSGVPRTRVILASFISMSIGLAIAGILAGAQLQQMQANDLSSLTMDVVAAVLVGGTAVAGGEGSPVRSAVGALLIVVISNIMLLHGFSTGLRLLGVGLLVTIVVSVLQLLRRRSVR